MRSTRCGRTCGRAAAVAFLAVATACTAAPSGPGAAVNGPPPLTVLKQGAGNGDIFITPQAGRYASGPEILTNTGKVIWFHAVPPGETPPTSGPRPTRAGRCSPGSRARGLDGTDYIYNDRYQQITEVKAGNGYLTDFHEFLITPWNTALILADAYGTANLTSIGGPADQKVFDGIVQEIDIPTGKVLFQWNSADHVPYRDSHNPRPASAAMPWDWFHINAVHLDTDGNLLINSRFTWTTYKVNLRTGKIIWELGGKQSTFKLTAAPGQVLDTAGEIFAFQHDPEAIGNGEYTFFDDESDGSTTLLPHSRVVTVKLDLTTKVATLVKSVDQPEGRWPRLRGTRRPPPTGTCSSAGARCPTSPSSAHPGNCCSTQAPGRRQHLPRLPPALAPGQLDSPADTPAGRAPRTDAPPVISKTHRLSSTIR